MKANKKKKKIPGVNKRQGIIFGRRRKRSPEEETGELPAVYTTEWLVRKILEDMGIGRKTSAYEETTDTPARTMEEEEVVTPQIEDEAIHAEDLIEPIVPHPAPDEEIAETVEAPPEENRIPSGWMPEMEEPVDTKKTEDIESRDKNSTIPEHQVTEKLTSADQQANVTSTGEMDSSSVMDIDWIPDEKEIVEDEPIIGPGETVYLPEGDATAVEKKDEKIAFEESEEITPNKKKTGRFRRKERASGKKTETGKEDLKKVPAEEIEEKKGLFSRFELKKPFGQKWEEYDPEVHGPLVDLVFMEKPGIDGVEVYPVNAPYAYIRITFNRHTHEYSYSVIEPEVSEDEEKILLELRERLYDVLDTSATVMTRDESKIHLRQKTDGIIQDYGIHLDTVAREKLLYRTERDFLGEGLIDAIMHDPYIEDISCDGVNSTIFVYHKHFESMRTNLKYTDEEELDSFVVKLAQRAGKFISIADPMLDATMKDGSRIQMTLGTEVTAHGSTFTIRKFSEEPITPTDLIEWSTFSPLSMAFLWLAVESGKSAIFAGGTASGKTTTLNALALFIPPLAKIVSLEDTRELQLPHPNWIPSVTRHSFDSAGRGEIDMYELLRAALRQRPEYILVGEVRGHEALTLFQAMSTGHVTYATMHADSVASAVHRLENSPIDVPRNMLSALDFISIQVQSRVGGQRIRRNKQIIEVIDLDPRTNELITNEVFTWHQSSDEIRFSGKSYILEEIMEQRAWTDERMAEELKRRQEVLEWMRQNNIRHFEDVSRVLVSYFRNPDQLIETIRSGR